MILFYITSGLFLGWSLGANDAANIFGSAVGSRMVTFGKAAATASIFVIAGAVIQGAGASDTLGDLGSVNAPGGSFTVALAAALTVFWMTRLSIPVSTTQAIVGAIIGWNLFTGNSTDGGSLTTIVTTWITGPILGALFAVMLFILIRKIKRSVHVHMIRYESWVRTGLVITGAFGAYSLGANNIANVMGVFVPSVLLDPVNLGLFTLSGEQQLFLIGGISIAAGIITYSEKVMKTVGNSLMQLTADAALVVVMAHSLVLFIFSSSTLSHFIESIGLPPIPLVPVSSSQVIVGSVLGIGLYRGVRNINFKTLWTIVSGWVTTPIIAGVISFISLFIVQNVFSIKVVSAPGPVMLNSETTAGSVASVNGTLLVIIVMVSAVAILFVGLWLNEKRKNNKRV
jgi:PiT family inorganic phosphate transporter